MRDRPTSAAAVFLLLAALVSPWNALTLLGQQPVDLFIAATTAMTLVSLLSQRATVPRLPQWIAVGFVSIFITTMVHTAAQSSFAQLGAGLKWILAATLVPWLCLTCSRQTPSFPTWAAKAWVTGIAASASVALSDYFGITAINQTLVGYVNISGRQGGLTTQPNNVGLTCAMGVPLALYFAQRQRRWSVVVVVLLGGAIVSGSRAGQASFILASLATVRWILPIKGDAKSTKRLLLFGTLSFAALLLASPAIRGKLEPMQRLFSNDNAVQRSNEGRIELLKDAIAAFRRNPLIGGGFDQLKNGHSIPVQLLATGGVILFCGFTFYIGFALKKGWQLRNESESGTGPAAAIGVGSWLAAGLVSNAISDRYLYFTVATIAVYRQPLTVTRYPHNHKKTGLPDHSRHISRGGLTAILRHYSDSKTPLRSFNSALSPNEVLSVSIDGTNPPRRDSRVD